VSLIGTQVSVLALPLTAILVLGATPQQLGLLGAAEFSPFLVVTLLAGAWIDRRRKRPVLVAADLGRALLLGLVPVLSLAHALRVEHLYVIAFLTGTLTVGFDIAYQSVLPGLVPRHRLEQANGRLQASASAAQVGGPGLGGILVQLLSAPFAVAIDALSYVASVVALMLIRTPEPRPAPPQVGLRRQIRDGLRAAFGNPYLRALTGAAASFNLFEQLTLTAFLLYATRQLELSAGLLGTIIAFGGAGALLGSLLAARVAERYGSGRTMVGGLAVSCASFTALPLAAGPGALTFALLVTGFALHGVGLGLFNVQLISLRQAITAPELLARVTASYRLAAYGTIPLGALLGGLLGATIGLRATLAVGAGGILLAIVWLVCSPIPGLARVDDGRPGPRGW
jgi:MFS family permease